MDMDKLEVFNELFNNLKSLKTEQRLETWDNVQRQFGSSLIPAWHIVASRSREDVRELIKQYDKVCRAANQLISLDEDIKTNPSYILGKLEGFGEFLEIAYELSIPVKIVSEMNKSDPLSKILLRLHEFPNGIKQRELRPDPIRSESNLTNYLQALEKKNLISRSRFGSELYVSLTNLGKRVVNALIEERRKPGALHIKRAKTPVSECDNGNKIEIVKCNASKVKPKR